MNELTLLVEKEKEKANLTHVPKQPFINQYYSRVQQTTLELTKNPPVEFQGDPLSFISEVNYPTLKSALDSIPNTFNKYVLAVSWQFKEFRNKHNLLTSPKPTKALKKKFPTRIEVRVHRTPSYLHGVTLYKKAAKPFSVLISNKR